ncbi:MerR family transcriptional regulator [Novosphingobium pituita]|uniref:MerR family transcriptional regulator n=1 Tax=Novosphingobium pituita TaxID=3056842 RepID=UPI00295E4B96|nr:MerR family transcriptional regulator [Novosphingobium sp. IK01]
MTVACHLEFPDGKAPDALRTIGEVARALGVKAHVLRYWEEQFPMLRPLTRAGNRRYYRAADVALVATIDRLVNRDGYTIRGARQALEGGLTPDAVTLAPSDEDSPEEQLMAESPMLEVELVAAIARLRVHLEDIRSNLADALEEA